MRLILLDGIPLYYPDRVPLSLYDDYFDLEPPWWAWLAAFVMIVAFLTLCWWWVRPV